MKIYSTLLFLFLIPLFCLSQNDNLDSLYKQLKVSQNDTSKINLLHKISRQHYLNGNIDSIIPLANSALILSQKINYKRGICLSYKNMGTAYKMYGENQMALNYYQKALKISEVIHDKKSEADILENIGLVYEGQDNYEQALKMFLQSLKIRENNKDSKGIANSYNNIGIIYANQSNNLKALEYYYKSLTLRKELLDNSGMAELYNNIGIVYIDQNKIDSAIYMNHISLKLKKELNHKDGLALSYNNLGLCYRLLNKMDSALFYHQKSLGINVEMKNKKGIALAASSIGYDYLKLKDLQKAEFYAEKAVNISREIKNLYIKNGAYLLLVKINKEKQDYKTALYYHELNSQINDSIYNIESQKNMTEMNAKYEAEKKESEIKHLNNVNKIKTLEIKEQQHRLNNHGILVVALLLLIVLIILMSWLVISKKEIKQKGILKTELLKQQELRTEAIIETQEQERKRIAQDLHDGIGQTLASVKINLVNITNQAEFVSEENQKKIKQTIKSLDDAYKEVRTLSHQMMPKALQEVGLSGAFDDLLEKTLANLAIKYTFEKDNIIRLNESTEIGLYRIFQELLNNILKHANANEIEVSLHTTNTHVILMVEDNGVGIKSNQNHKAGIGLSNIEARVHTLKGTFSINMGANKGTVAVVRIPNN